MNPARITDKWGQQTSQLRTDVSGRSRSEVSGCYPGCLDICVKDTAAMAVPLEGVIGQNHKSIIGFVYTHSVGVVLFSFTQFY